MRHYHHKYEPKPVKASQIPTGECFRKVQGTHIFARISPWTVKQLGLDSECVYGFSLVSGNYCKIEMDTVVIREYVVFRRRIPQPLSQPDSVTRREPNGDHRTD